MDAHGHTGQGSAETRVRTILGALASQMAGYPSQVAQITPIPALKRTGQARVTPVLLLPLLLPPLFLIPS
jgi:hypothetical protein